MTDNQQNFEPNQTATENSSVPAQPPINSGPVVSDYSPSSSKKAWAILVLVALVIVAGVVTALAFNHNKKRPVTTAVNSGPPPAIVDITSTGFSPATITIDKGQAVSWVNNDTAPHTVSSDPYPSDNALVGFDSKNSLLAKDSFNFVFGNTGTFTYHDNLHPYALQGTVVVK